MGNGGLGLSFTKRVETTSRSTALVGFTCNDADGCHDSKCLQAPETGMAGTIQFLPVSNRFGSWRISRRLRQIQFSVHNPLRIRPQKVEIAYGRESCGWAKVSNRNVANRKPR